MLTTKFSKTLISLMSLLLLAGFLVYPVTASAQESQEESKSFGEIRDEVVQILDLQEESVEDSNPETNSGSSSADSNMGEKAEEDKKIPGEEKTDLTREEIETVEIECNEGLIGTKTRCSFEIPEGKKLPEALKLSVGQVEPSGECVPRIDGDGKEIQVCDQVPVTSDEGQQDIFLQTESEEEPISINKNTEVTRVASELETAKVSQLNSTRSLFCSPRSVKKGQTVDCGGSLPSTITPPSNGLFLKAGENGKVVECEFSSNEPGASFECLDLLVNSDQRTVSILGSVNGDEYVDSGYKVIIEENKEKAVPANSEDSELIDTVRSGGETTVIAILTISAAIVGFYFWDKKRKSELKSEYKKLNL